MKRRKTIAIVLLLTTVLTTWADSKKSIIPISQWTQTQLEQELNDLESELKQLSHYTVRSGTGARGYLSTGSKTPNQLDWILIKLPGEVSIDQVVLVPVLYRNSNTGIRSAGFPSALRVVAGTDTHSHVVATLSAKDNLLPRIAPLSISFTPVTASWVRIETEDSSLNPIRNSYHIQLSEILVFSGMKNIALHQPVLSPDSAKRPRRAHNERYLTDGFTPYVMDAAEGSTSISKTITVKSDEETPTLSIDLNTPHSIDQINLHAANIALSIPMLNFDCLGMPRHIRVTAANQPDFSDQTLLFEHQQQSIYDHGPIVMQHFPATTCRYIRIEILDHRPIVEMENTGSQITFSEIEVISQGKNIAQGLPVDISSNLFTRKNSLSRLTDGLNYYGKILPTKEWINQLARRHDLETSRPLLVNELSLRYQRQKTHLARIRWLAIILALSTIAIIFLARVIQQWAIMRTRQRIAANLHDELGANLHAIGLLGDLAKQEINETDKSGKWDQLIEYLEEIRTLTTQTGKTAHYCTNMLEAKDFATHPQEDIKKIAELLHHDLEHTLSIENENALPNLKPRQRIGLILFYKECITNIIRHAHATRAKTSLTANQKEITLVVTDNGKGVQQCPPSLKRRARLLKAKLSLTHPTDGGTQITLRLRHRSKKEAHAEN